MLLVRLLPTGLHTVEYGVMEHRVLLHCLYLHSVNDILLQAPSSSTRSMAIRESSMAGTDSVTGTSLAALSCHCMCTGLGFRQSVLCAPELSCQHDPSQSFQKVPLAESLDADHQMITCVY